MATTAQYEAIQRALIEALEAGTVPWRKPWASSLPYNAKSKKPYRGLNVMTLHAQGYDDPRWVTFKQARDRGGYVRKGEKSTMVFFWDFSYRVEVEDPDTHEIKTKRIPLLKIYSVFNVEQCDGLNLPVLPVVGAAERVERAEAIAQGYADGPRVTHAPGARACYAPVIDSVFMPPVNTFESSEGYYSTLFHELGHSTGHTSRLNRFADTAEEFDGGRVSYSFEELVAEFTAAFLSGEAQLTCDNQLAQSAAYLKSWLAVLKGNARWAIKAAGLAQRAADRILGRDAAENGSEPPSDGAEATSGVAVLSGIH
jgi:antirestriction protein ArdC